MDIMEALITRRSIRKFSDRAIDDSHIREMIRAACYAPSAVDKRPWEFVVIRERASLERITHIHPHAKMLLQASCAILLCAVPDRAHTPDYAPIDLSAATENLLLAAHGLGLGGCWLGVYPRPERMAALRELLSIPVGIVPFSLIALGYPAEHKEAPERYSEKLVHQETW